MVRLGTFQVSSSNRLIASFKSGTSNSGSTNVQLSGFSSPSDSSSENDIVAANFANVFGVGGVSKCFAIPFNEIRDSAVLYQSFAFGGVDGDGTKADIIINCAQRCMCLYTRNFNLDGKTGQFITRQMFPR